MRKLLITLMLFLSAACTLRAACDMRAENRIAFRVNSSEIEASLGDNARSLAAITGMLDSISRTEGIWLKGIEFSGAASPEGPLPLNSRLAEKRR